MNVNEYSERFRNWSELSERQKGFFCGNEYLPLPSAHSERIALLNGKLARDFIQRALSQIPEYKGASPLSSRIESMVELHDVWGTPERTQSVRQWLYDRGVPFRTTVYLLYDYEVVRTDWRCLVRYWDALAWSVGMAMVATDLSGRWACEFHHEDVITFYEYKKQA